MATTSPDNIWTPDAGDDYALTTDLAATADTIQAALNTVRTDVVAQVTAGRVVLNAGAATTIPNTVATVVAFPTPGALPAGMSWASNQMTITGAAVGRYRLSVSGRWQTNGTGYRQLTIQQNGSAIATTSGPGVSGVELGQLALGVVNVASGDTLRVVVQHNIGSSVEFRGAQFVLEKF